MHNRLITSRLLRAMRQCVVAASLLMGMQAARAIDCPRAVLFDLGDTLVQSGAGGLFFAKPGAQTMLDQLQADGLQLGVITNVPAGFTRANLDALLDDPAFLNQFDIVVLSSQAPASKPSPLIYLHAHGLLPTPLPIAQTAFVGETLSEIANSAVSPTSGARATGMIGIHLSNAAPSALADFTVSPSALTTIPTLIDGLCLLPFGNGFELAGR